MPKISFQYKNQFIAADFVIDDHKYQMFHRIETDSPTREDYKFLAGQVYTKFPQLKETNNESE